jgi:hypothetical protein
VLLIQGEPQRALPLLERAVATAAAHEGIREGDLEARFYLAQALVAAGGDRARARVEAEQTREGLREAGPGKAEVLAEVEQWLAE